MADAILGGDDAARKNLKTPNSLQTTVSSTTMVRRLPCLIDLPALTPDAQLKIFDTIDETGSATLAELVAALETIEAPAGLIVDLAVMGILEIDASRFLDGASLVRRAPMHIAREPKEEPPKSGSKPRSKAADRTQPTPAPVPYVVAAPGERYAPSIFYADWSARDTLLYNPTVNGSGVYLGIFDDEIHVGMSTQLHSRVRTGKHVLRQGQPPHTLVVVTDVEGRLDNERARALERLLAQAVIGRDHRDLANAELPKGDRLSRGEFLAVERLAEAAIVAIAELGLAFTGTELPAAAPQEGTQYRLEACGVKALATQTADGFVVHQGSQVRLEVMPSAGSGPIKRRHDLLSNGIMVRRSGHFVLLEDLVFSTASGATSFVLGSRHHPGIWTAMPQDPAPPRA